MPGAHRRRSSRRKLFNILRREGNAGRIFPTFDYSNEFCDNFNLAGGPGSESEEELRWKIDRLEREPERLQMSGMQALHTMPYHGMQAGALCIPSEEKGCIRGRSVKSRDWVLERRDEF